MARHTGKNGKAKFGANFFTAVVDWSIDEKVGAEDLTAMGDTWETHEATQKSWTGSITVRRDPTDTAQSARAGDSVAVELYSEGDAATKKYFSGTATLESHGVEVSYNGAVARKYALKGNGPLTEATVGA